VVQSDISTPKDGANRTKAGSGVALLVDDNPLILNVLRGLLNNEGIRVLSSTNGQEALEILDQQSVDVIVCDVMMPRMDGYQLHERVRGCSKYAHIPFVFLSALGDNAEISQAKENGADDYLVKPFDPRELIAVVRGKIQRSKSIKGAETERYDSYRKRVIHTLSHEFRTPLVAINTGAELLLEQRDRLDHDKAANLLEAIKRGGERLERLVNDFMLLQQIEGGLARRLFESRASVHSIQAVLDRIIEAREEMISGERCTLDFSKIPYEISVRIYEPQIQDILDRLINNAIKFSTTERSIEIHSSLRDREVGIEIRDRGLGMDAIRTKEAVDAFGQINREKMEQQGSGLGLAIASRYAEINDGRLEFEERAGGGTIVTLILPTVS